MLASWHRSLGKFVGPILIAAITVLGPWVLPRSVIGVGTLCALYLVAGVGLNVLLGYTEQVSFGQGAFWAVGAYGVAIFTLKAHLPVVASGVAAIVLTAVVAAIVGWPMTQLRGHYIAVATLAFALIVEDLASNLHGLTGGTVGLPNIPPLVIFGYRFVGNDLYRLCWGIALVVLVITANVSRSRSGRAFRSVGADDSGSQALGVPSGAYRLRAFIYAGTLAGVGGTMYAFYIGYVAPDAFGPQLSALLLVVLMVGGMRSPYGAVIGAVAVTALTQGLARLAADPALPANVAPAINVLSYGVLIFLVMRFAPSGILPLAQRSAAKAWKRLRGDLPHADLGTVQPEQEPAGPSAGRAEARRG